MSTASRKVRAIAAGSAVVGLGAALTLAAWSDSEFAKGTFSTANFGIEGAAGDNNFSEHATRENALELTFNPSNLQPGQTTAHAYQIRNIAGGVDSTVTYANEFKEGALAGSLTTEIVQTADTTCTPQTTGTVLAQGGTFNLSEQTPQNLCIKVKVADNYEGQNEQGTIVWQFDAAPQNQ
ncbi:SipW-dependent-type signal peptide-containing protein [Corynebacterium urinipleomorphum]|uniref:SipW-dependent-type signal peptide-containing protein n=1 Tax=Corynebacterium urinipleomorphum TaxID=1852380 RepID=UPI000B3528FE|nr:SipW-dependent-type signal peptide-containing protein [Corynebacterium urinipleomorphum]